MRIWKIFLNLFVGVPFSWILMCTPLLPNSIKLVSRPTHWPAWCSSHQALRASSIFRSGHFLLCAPRSAISSDMMNSWMNQETHLRFSLYICIFRKLICRFLSVFLLPQSLLDMNCVTLILSQLDEQRQRGRTLTQADTVRHCLCTVYEPANKLSTICVMWIPNCACILWARGYTLSTPFAGTMPVTSEFRGPDFKPNFPEKEMIAYFVARFSLFFSV